MSDFSSSPAAVPLTESVYGTMPDGREVKLYTLTNSSGIEAKVTNYGAVLVSLRLPDRDGKFADVTHGYDTLEGWLGDSCYFGATVGRFGNRIAGGKFTLDGREYRLATNDRSAGLPCSLHGGGEGFSKKLWQSEVASIDGANAVRLTYLSADGEEGYPGELTVVVIYHLTEDNELIWDVTATTKAPTVLNIVHHTYWNLSGDPASSIHDHQLTLYADHYLGTNAGMIPTGERIPVAGTPMDFTKATLVGERIGAAYEALTIGGGYDHAWVLNGTVVGDLAKAAKLRDPKTGRTLTLSTNQPAVQFYSGNFLGGGTAGKGGVSYPRRSALCLETENYPDAPNNPNAPSAVLRPGETYHHRMIHAFSTE